jgi:hypothetical protein
MIEEKCCICEGMFRSHGMKGDKCLVCAKQHPNAHSKDDIKNKEQKERAELLNEKVVRKIVIEILNEAGIEQSECEKCKAKFFKRSPAQKVCKKCSEKKSSEAK